MDIDKPKNLARSVTVEDYNEKELPILYRSKKECCGCTACYAICTNEAISMVEDEEGFEYPKINESKCVHCYQCIKVCPIKAAKNQ